MNPIPICQHPTIGSKLINCSIIRNEIHKIKMHIENIQKRYRIKIFPGKNSPGSGFGVFNGLAMAAGGKLKKLRVREMNKGKDKRKKITLKLS